jgi:hypothetical protein
MKEYSLRKYKVKSFYPPAIASLPTGTFIVSSEEWIPVSEGTELEQIDWIKADVVTEETKKKKIYNQWLT